MSCATTTIKYLVFIFNTLCALLGIGTIAVNSLALPNVNEDGRLVCIFLIVLGCIVFLISFFGCCGAIRENSCFIWTYAVFLLILIVANAVILFGYISKLDGVTLASQNVRYLWSIEIKGLGNDPMSKLQGGLGCCGQAGPQDYAQFNMTIPASCYLGGNNSTTTNLYQDGCARKLIIHYKTTERLVFIFSWITLGVECAALICACILGINFRNQERRSKY